jgi:hypothetical protein
VSVDANAATLSGLPVPPASDQANPAIWLAVRSFDRCRLRGEPSATGGNIDADRPVARPEATSAFRDSTRVFALRPNRVTIFEVAGGITGTHGERRLHPLA